MKKGQKNAIKSAKPSLDKQESSASDGQKIPSPLAVISTLCYAAFIFLLFTGIIFLSSGIIYEAILKNSQAINSMVSMEQYVPSIAGLIYIMQKGILIGAISILASILFMMINIGLRKGKKWGRLLAIVTVILLMLSYLIILKELGFLTWLFLTLFNIMLILYLSIDKDAITYCKN